MSINRAFIIVMDSFGLGEMADAASFGDVGANTLASVAKSSKFNTPNMKKLGLFNIDGVTVGEKEANPIGAFAKLAEVSLGKDTTVGHWEIAGVISENPLPTYPNGFPIEVCREFEKRTGKKMVCNLPYSGTAVLDDYGQHHVQTGDLIVYTSADSVFQIAAHEDVVSVEKLYEYCQIARDILVGDHGVGRVIARPFVGEFPEYKRTSNRHDYSLLPPKKTMLDVLTEKGLDTIGIGKIGDIFAGKGISHSTYTKNNIDGMKATFETQSQDFKGLCFINLVDFDMLYGHRNDVDGYAEAATEFDKMLEEFMKNMRDDDLLIITADHGCDPGFNGTDHTREYVPMIAYGAMVKQGTNLGIRTSFADIGATVLDIFGSKGEIDGTSFLAEIVK